MNAPIILGEIDAAGRARLEAAKALVRASEARMRMGCGMVLMMADPGAARRAREKRQRDRAEIGLLHYVPVRNMFRLVDLLIDLGFVGEDESADHKAVSAAVGKLLDDFVTRDSQGG